MSDISVKCKRKRIAWSRQSDPMATTGIDNSDGSDDIYALGGNKLDIGVQVLHTIPYPPGEDHDGPQQAPVESIANAEALHQSLLVTVPPSRHAEYMGVGSADVLMWVHMWGVGEIVWHEEAV